MVDLCLNEKLLQMNRSHKDSYFDYDEKCYLYSTKFIFIGEIQAKNGVTRTRFEKYLRDIIFSILTCTVTFPSL